VTKREMLQHFSTDGHAVVEGELNELMLDLRYLKKAVE